MQLVLIMLFIAVHGTYCLPVKQTVAVLRLTSENNLAQDARQYDSNSRNEQFNVSEEMIIFHRKKHVRRDLSSRNQNKTKFFVLCVLKKDGKCIRRKRFGMWNSSTSPKLKSWIHYTLVIAEILNSGTLVIELHFSSRYVIDELRWKPWQHQLHPMRTRILLCCAVVMVTVISTTRIGCPSKSEGAQMWKISVSPSTPSDMACFRIVYT